MPGKLELEMHSAGNLCNSRGIGYCACAARINLAKTKHRFSYHCASFCIIEFGQDSGQSTNLIRVLTVEDELTLPRLSYAWNQSVVKPRAHAATAKEGNLLPVR